MQQPFPDQWEQILRTHVTFLREHLTRRGRHGFGNWCRSFSTRSGLRGAARRRVDETIRVSVTGRAVIPIFGFHDWDTIGCAKC